MSGLNPMTINQGTPFVDPGASWDDLSEGSGTITTASSGIVNTGTVGTYTLTYSKTDGSGSIGSADRIVNVVSGPTVTINQKSNQ